MQTGSNFNLRPSCKGTVQIEYSRGLPRGSGGQLGGGRQNLAPENLRDHQAFNLNLYWYHLRVPCGLHLYLACPYRVVRFQS